MNWKFRTKQKTLGDPQAITKKGVFNKIRNFGSFLAGMVMPAIGAFIAFGLLAAFLVNIENETTKLLKPLTTIIFNALIVSLIAFFGGKQIYGIRGGVIGLITSAGFIYASSTSYYINISNTILGWPTELDIKPIPIPTGTIAALSGQPMILGAMVGGPLSAWIFKKLELWWTKYIPSGFEMLINNVSIGIYIAIIAVTWFYGLSAVVAFITAILTIVIAGLQFGNVTWLLPFIVEPAKVFFLNNAVNHGVFTPLGTIQAESLGKSMLFYIETSPATGLGVLMIFYFFSGNKVLKAQALAAMPLVFFGGIHELYFPFVLANLFLLPVLMVGGAIAVVLYIIFNAGATNVISPGSIILDYTFTHADANSYIGYTLGWICDTAFTFFVGSALMIFVRKRRGERVFFSFKLQAQNAMFQKRLNPKSLDKLSKKGQITNINYEQIPNSKNYLVEKIVYDNGNVEQFIIKSNSPKIVRFVYQETAKKNQTKLYLYRIFEKQKPCKKNKTYGFDLASNQYVKRESINVQTNPLKIKDISYEVKPNYLIQRQITLTNKKNKVKNYKQILDPSVNQISLNEYNEQKQKINNLSLEKTQENSLASNDNKITLIANQLENVKTIIFACDAGMGSSAMGAGILRNMLKEYKKLNITATNKAIKNLNQDDLFIVTQRSFEPLIKEKGIDQNKVYYINQFLAKKEYDDLKQALEVLNNKR